jgi:hypothetical protein
VKSYFPVYNQHAGRESYSNINNKDFKLGISQGTEGWVDMYLEPNGLKSIEKYLPEGNISLYNPSSRRINLKHLELGSQIQIAYGFEVTTFYNNTEVWCRSVFPKGDKSITSFVANLKYQYTYELYSVHNLTISTEQDRVSGVIPQIMSDLDAIAKLKNIYVSVF